MEIIKKKLLHITLASLVTLIVYIFLNVIIRAVFVEMLKLGEMFAAFVLAVFVAGVFACIYTWLFYVRTGHGDDEFFEDHPESYGGLLCDIKLIVKREHLTFAVIGAINFVVWLAFAALGKSPVTALFVVFYPIQPLSGVFTAAHGFIDKLIGTVLVCAALTLVFALLRRRWNKNRL